MCDFELLKAVTKPLRPAVRLPGILLQQSERVYSLKSTVARIAVVFSSLALAGGYIGTQFRQRPSRQRPLVLDEKTIGTFVTQKPPKIEPARPAPVRRIDPAGEKFDMTVMPSTKVMVLRLNNLFDEPEPAPFDRQARYKPAQEVMSSPKD